MIGGILFGIGWLIYMAGLGIYKVGKEAYYRFHPEKRPEMKEKLAEQARGMEMKSLQKKVEQPKEAKKAVPLASAQEIKPAQQVSMESSLALQNNIVAERTRAKSSAALTARVKEEEDASKSQERGGHSP